MKPGTIIKRFNTKKDRDAVIRYIRSSDLPSMLEYANALSAEDTFVLLSGETLTLAEEKRYVKAAVQEVRKNKKIYVVIEVDGKFAGACEVRIGERRKSHTGEISISLAAPYRDEGIGTICMYCLIDQAKKLNLKLLWLHCFENNDRALALYRKVGFVDAGLVPDMYSYKGGFVGELTLYKKI
jgi:RimJ/RimL family protein N-acetyltransferase